ncbi:STAS domain-containing protein [Streptomyces sp. TP-A0356]|uniref:STAS domain-containing protein n=1 Tax=Streptomyces sp. TP-A0356 TaxID=1359208 RepID=UPI000B2BE6CB|nr:STAS domain-containing protein [Streptomyces sp. TP-A0356]
MTIISASVDGAHVIAVRGEIDHHTGGALSDALSLPEGTVALRMVVSGVTFMDHSGSNILIAARNAADGAGGWLRLAGPSESVLARCGSSASMGSSACIPPFVTP